MNTPTDLQQSQGARGVENVAKRAPTVQPLVDVFENASELLLVADVPGADKDSIQVHLDKGQLSLYARRSTSKGSEGTISPLTTEYRAFDYYRAFAVPTGIDSTKIEAELVAGVLKVRLPKSEALKPRRIEVRAS